MPERLFPKWLTDSLADYAQESSEGVERLFGPEAAAEGYEIAAQLRAAGLSGGESE